MSKSFYREGSKQGTQAPSRAPRLIPAETEHQLRTNMRFGITNGGTSIAPGWSSTGLNTKVQEGQHSRDYTRQRNAGVLEDEGRMALGIRPPLGQALLGTTSRLLRKCSKLLLDSRLTAMSE